MQIFTLSELKFCYRQLQAGFYLPKLLLTSGVKYDAGKYFFQT